MPSDSNYELVSLCMLEKLVLTSSCRMVDMGMNLKETIAKRTSQVEIL